MKVAFFNYLPLEYGGGLAMFYQHITPLLQQAAPTYTYMIITFDKKFARRISKLYSVYYRKPQYEKFVLSPKEIKHAIPGIIYKKVRSFSELQTVVKEVDIVYTKNDFLELVILRMLSTALKGKRVIVGHHTPLLYPSTPSFQAKFHNLLYSSLLYNYLLRIGTNHHVLTNETKKILQRWHIRRIQVVPQPFDFESYRISVKNGTSFVKEKKKIYITWIGRLTEQKGVSDLIDIINRVSCYPESERVRWIIAGSGELEHEIRKLTDVNRSVLFLGFVPPEQLPGLYQKSDVYISTSKWENLPFTFLEASSFGLPIITYALPGIHEIVPKRYGLTVSTTGEFVDTIRLLLKKKKLVKTRRSTNFVKKFSNRQVITQFLKAFITS